MLPSKSISSMTNKFFSGTAAGFSAGLVDDSDIFKWEVLIIGPPG